MSVESAVNESSDKWLFLHFTVATVLCVARASQSVQRAFEGILSAVETEVSIPQGREIKTHQEGVQVLNVAEVYGYDCCVHFHDLCYGLDVLALGLCAPQAHRSDGVVLDPLHNPLQIAINSIFFVLQWRASDEMGPSYPLHNEYEPWVCLINRDWPLGPMRKVRAWKLLS